MVLTTAHEAPDECMMPVLHEDIFERHPVIIRGLMIQKLDMGYGQDDLLVGIDPGHRMGLSVFYRGREIESSVYSSMERLAVHVVQILEGLGAKRKTVKVGNGNIDVARRIATLLNLQMRLSFELEFVDEQKTSPKVKHFNQGGKRDMLSARYISQREGRRVLACPVLAVIPGRFRLES